MATLDIDGLRRRLVAAGLAKYADSLVRVIEPSIRLVAEPVDEASIPLGGSKLGGLPDLPPGTAWPRFRGRPLAFIAQLAMREVQGHPGSERLPPDGLLSFFYDGEQEAWGFDPAHRGGWWVSFVPPGSPLERAPHRADLADHARFTACLLRPQAELTLAPWESFDVEALGLGHDESMAYAGVLPEMEEGIAVHRLLGHPDPVQGDMQLEVQLASHGIYCGDADGPNDPRARLLRHGAGDWRLLLQIDSEDHAGMMWGDVGRLYYWLHRDDLAQRRFDRTWCILQCG